MSNRPLAIAVLAVLAVSACASRPEDPVAQASYDEADDPAEPTNRAIFAFNQFVDSNLLKPVSRTYADYMPDLAKSSIHNFVANLGEPLVFANDLLQGNISRAAVTTGRLVVNSTVGVAGLFDPAASDVLVAGGVLDVVDRRAEILPVTDSLERSSLDYYAALRSVVAARREALVEEGKEGAVQPEKRRESHGFE